MGDLNSILGKLRSEVQARCAERIKEAQALSCEKISINKPKEEYGVSSVLKRKHGL